MQDVAEFVLKKGIQLDDYFDPRVPAVIDDEHLVRINYEAYFFGDIAARERFVQQLVDYCGLVTDPVTKRRFRPTPESPQFELERVIYMFESADTEHAFLDAPEKYMLPGYQMPAPENAASERSS